MERDKRNQISKRIASISILILLIVLLALISNITDENFEYIVDESKLQIIYFDVGQADSALIMNNGKTTLIDGGNDSDGDDLVKYIKSQKISKIDTVIATHLHADHIGGLDDIIDNFDIGTVYMPDTINTDKQVEEFLDAMERKKLNYEVPEVGEKFKNGLAHCEVMAIDNKAKDLNNSSIVIQMNYLEQRYLFMGDSEKEVENSRDWNKVNILKVGHHGSDTSSSKKFIQTLAPEISVISVEKDNFYGHPNQEVIERLEEVESKIYRTDEVGNVFIEQRKK